MTGLRPAEYGPEHTRTGNPEEEPATGVGRETVPPNPDDTAGTEVSIPDRMETGQDYTKPGQQNTPDPTVPDQEYSNPGQQDPAPGQPRAAPEHPNPGKADPVTG